jgi:hypothetical protein
LSSSDFPAYCRFIALSLPVKVRNGGVFSASCLPSTFLHVMLDWTVVHRSGIRAENVASGRRIARGERVLATEARIARDEVVRGVGWAGFSTGKRRGTGILRPL